MLDSSISRLGYRFVATEGGRCGFNILHAAVLEGNVALVKHILSKYPELVNYGSESGYTPLMAAVERNSAEIVELLLEKGATVNTYPTYTDHQHMGLHTSLDLAVWNKHQGLVRRLIAAGGVVRALASCNKNSEKQKNKNKKRKTS
jgi:ankyrin repeat protein